MKIYKFQKILELAYTQNDRLQKLFERIEKFYNEGTIKPTRKVQAIARKIMIAK
jgi:hypothetical protein